MLNSFKNGVHPAGAKYLTRNAEIEAGPVPEKVYIPLSQHIGAPAVPVVEAGQTVKKGQLIAKAGQGLSAPVFSSVAGTVKGIVSHITLSGKKRDHILIENDFSEEEERLPALSEITRDSVLERIADAGIVGMGGATFPTFAKLNIGQRDADYVIVNGAECEPYITCDFRIMVELTDKLLKGIRCAMLACGAKRAVIGIEDNKPEAIDLLSTHPSCLPGGSEGLDGSHVKISVKKLKTKYPQGAEKQLIYACCGRVVPEGKLPIDAGAVVVNVHTALSIYDAVFENKPCYERVMTVSGKAVAHPKNIWVRTGTLFHDIADFCGADDEKAESIVAGGPMMGENVFSLKACAGKGSSSLLFLDKSECEIREADPCIGCGKCVQACPMGLMPVFIESSLFHKDLEDAKRFGAKSCIGCGCCSYVCPAKRYLVQSVKLAKKMIHERGI